MQDEYRREFGTEQQAIMELDPSQDNLNGVTTPTVLDKLDGYNMSLDPDEHTKQKSDVDASHAVSADDRILLLHYAYADDAMKALTLEPLGDLEVLHEGHFTWEIRNYSKLPLRNLSPEFECGGFKWYSR